MKFSVLITLFLISIAGLAATLRDVTMPDTETVNGKKLVLNGMGLREVTVMGVDIRVYIGGLYVEKKSTKGEEILAEKFPKRVKMQFLRRVSQGDYRKSWKEIIKSHCPTEGPDKGCAKSADQAENFYKILDEVKEGEVLNYTFDGKGFEITKGDKKWGRVEGVELTNIILNGWLGPKPFDSGLKSGLLGEGK